MMALMQGKNFDNVGLKFKFLEDKVPQEKFAEALKNFDAILVCYNRFTDVIDACPNL